MIIGVPRETRRHEHRVGLTPFAVSRLVRHGHTVLVERDAGEGARFRARDFEAAGARPAYSSEEVYRRAELVCRVGLVPSEEVEFLEPGATICAFQHLAVTPRDTVERLCRRGVTLIGYEIIRDDAGELPVLLPFSEMGGAMAVHLAAYYLQNESGGRGVLFGNIAGVPPPTVLILGAGSVGRSAARQALACGAHVIVLDADLRRLRAMSRELDDRVVTGIASVERLTQFTPIADVVIGAILIPGARAPFLVSEAMVRAMKPGSVILDVSIDQGGCVETSRPTTLDAPVFAAHGVLHYCVPNMTANVARTASRALASAALPYLLSLADQGLDPALREHAGLADGLYMYRGHIVHAGVGQALGLPVTAWPAALGGGAP